VSIDPVLWVKFYKGKKSVEKLIFENPEADEIHLFEVDVWHQI
jgi:hypothetical protein